MYPDVLVKQLTSNQQVRGSSPRGITIKINNLYIFCTSAFLSRETPGKHFTFAGVTDCLRLWGRLHSSNRVPPPSIPLDSYFANPTRGVPPLFQ
jgi:hypothetical protein